MSFLNKTRMRSQQVFFSRSARVLN